MKRRELIRHVEGHSCEFLREGSDHTVYVNRAAQKTSTIPRHREINDFLARKICRDFTGSEALRRPFTPHQTHALVGRSDGAIQVD